MRVAARRASRVEGAGAAAAARLAAALAEPGCPVCRCLEADARRDLAAFLREQTMDPAGRAALRRAGGFCGWHTSLLRDAADGILSVALLAEDLLGHPAPARVACPVCPPVREAAAAYLAALLEGASDPARRRALAAGPGVPCRPHLEAAIAPRLRHLGAALTAFIAKQDYRSAEPPTADEARAWGEALEHLAGRPALFGSELQGPPG
jgi:hypothetical protein